MVQLKPTDHARGYINANYVRSFGGKRMHEYIAAQGPLPSTVGHFIQMVYQKKSAIVVQTTGFKEKGKVKCERYFPETVGDTLVFGTYSVTTNTKVKKEGYNV